VCSLSLDSDSHGIISSMDKKKKNLFIHVYEFLQHKEKSLPHKRRVEIHWVIGKEVLFVLLM